MYLHIFHPPPLCHQYLLLEDDEVQSPSAYTPTDCQSNSLNFLGYHGNEGHFYGGRPVPCNKTKTLMSQSIDNAA